MGATDLPMTKVCKREVNINVPHRGYSGCTKFHTRRILPGVPPTTTPQRLE
jgi:hypothetical protein